MWVTGSMLSGDVFYSKTLKKNVLYKGSCWGRNEYISIGYHPFETYTDEQVGELEPLVRHCHYDAAMKTNERFVSAMLAAMSLHKASDRDGDYYSQGWWDALDFIAEKCKLAEPEV